MAKWNIGAKNGMWKGGRSVASNGYVLIRVGKEHHLADVRGYAYEHRLIAEKKLGRRLRKGELGHHDNEVKADNRPENIIPTTRSEHGVLHRKPGSNRRLPGERNLTMACVCGCGKTFRKFDSFGRPRTYLSGHNHDLSIQESFLQVVEGGARLRQIAARTGQSLQAVKTMASILVQKNQIARLGRGFYGRTNRHPLD